MIHICACEVRVSASHPRLRREVAARLVVQIRLVGFTAAPDGRNACFAVRLSLLVVPAYLLVTEPDRPGAQGIGRRPGHGQNAGAIPGGAGGKARRAV